ncbi:MAG: hypothetical protein ILP02_00060, partial [Clostridia bacterium]|nr:hypothetical protein [Clostridia bacterium]
SNVYKIPASFGASGAVAVFNDVTRDGIKGGGFDRKTRGLVNGNPSYRSIIDVCFGIAGGIKTDGVEWHTAVGNVINYDCCHDDLTIFDKLKASTGDADDRILYMAKLSAAIIFASHGVPFILAGEEFMRTKKGDGNSYKSGDDINALDWESLKPGSLNIELSAYYERLIALRKRYDFLRRGSAICKIVADAVIEVGYYTDGNLEAKALINANDRNEYVDLGGEFKKVFDGWSFVEENTSAGYINAKSLTLFIKR